MPIEAVKLENIIRKGFPDAEVEIRDLAGDGDHYQARIVSSVFQGKSRVMQHKMVHETLKGTEAESVHALSIVTQAK